jgi:hypothetical protein
VEIYTERGKKIEVSREAVVENRRHRKVQEVEDNYIKGRFRICCCFWRNSPTRARASSCSRFVDHAQWHTTFGRTPLDEGSARHRDFSLTTYNTHKTQTSMPPAGLKIANPSKWEAVDPRLRPIGHPNRLSEFVVFAKFYLEIKRG